MYRAMYEFDKEMKNYDELNEAAKELTGNDLEYHMGITNQEELDRAIDSRWVIVEYGKTKLMAELW